MKLEITDKDILAIAGDRAFSQGWRTGLVVLIVTIGLAILSYFWAPLIYIATSALLLGWVGWLFLFSRNKKRIAKELIEQAEKQMSLFCLTCQNFPLSRLDARSLRCFNCGRVLKVPLQYEAEFKSRIKKFGKQSEVVKWEALQLRVKLV